MSISRPGSRPLLRCVPIAVVSLLAACGGNDGPAGPGPTTIHALTAAPRAGEPLHLRVRAGSLPAGTYEGTMAGTPVSFIRADDSTLFALVPESVSGEVRVVATLDRVAPATTVSVAAARAVADPAGAIAAALDEATAAAFADTLPTGVDAQAWAADSVKIVAGLQQARDAAATLAAADQLSLARLLVSFRERAATIASATSVVGTVMSGAASVNVASQGTAGAPMPRRQGAVGATPGSDQKCVLAANAWKTAAEVSNDAMKSSRASNLGVRQVLEAYGTLEYMVAYAMGAEGAVACRYPTDYLIEGAQIDDQGTTFIVSAVVRSLQEADRATSLTSQAYDDARKATVSAWNWIVDAVEWKPLSKAQIPEPPPEPRRAIAPQYVELEYDRVLDVTGLPNVNGGPNGSAPATVAAEGDRVRLDVRARVEDRKQAGVEFVFTPAGVPQRRKLEVPVQRCEEQQQWYQRCSYGVKIEPDDVGDFVVGGKLVLTGRVYAKDLTELPNRRITWSRGSNAIALSTTTGATTTVTALAQTSAASVRAEAADAIRGVPGEEFYRVVGWNVDYTWLGVTGYAALWDFTSDDQPIVRYGAPVRLHFYWINSITKQPLLVDYSKVGIELGDAAPYIDVALEPDDRGVWATFTRPAGSPEMNLYLRFSYDGQVHTGALVAIGTRD